MGANWVIFPIMGERVFPVLVRGMDAAQSGVLAMTLLMGARGIGALTGPLAASPWAAGLGSRMRAGILAAFMGSALGYIGLSCAP